jgi:hypothetical protein
LVGFKKKVRRGKDKKNKTLFINEFNPNRFVVFPSVLKGGSDILAY